MEKTTYYSHGKTFEAVILSWKEVTDILGKEHDGSPEDDNRLRAALLAMGAPAWVSDAEGWLEEAGWGLIGPEILD